MEIEFSKGNLNNKMDSEMKLIKLQWRLLRKERPIYGLVREPGEHAVNRKVMYKEQEGISGRKRLLQMNSNGWMDDV